MNYCVKCKVPFAYAEISTDGEIHSCCRDYSYTKTFGNIYESNFEKCWYSKTAKELREKILNNDYSGCNCDFCTSDTAVFGFELDDPIVGDIDYNTKPDYPKVVKMSQDNSCNVMCTICREEIICNIPKEVKFHNTNIDKYLSVLKNAKVVDITGGGDPFASQHYRTLIPEIIKRYPGIKFNLHTNGILCTKENLEKLNIHDKLRIVQISLHSATKNTYDKIVLKGNYDKVIENLKYLSEMKKEGKLYDIFLIFAISKINYEEIPQFIELAKNFNAKALLWIVRDRGVSGTRNIDELAIFDTMHPEHENFVKIMIQDCLKESHVKLSPYLKKFTCIDSLDNYLLSLSIFKRTFNKLLDENCKMYDELQLWRSGKGEKRYKKYPKWLIMLACLFIFKEKNRKRLIEHHMKG